MIDLTSALCMILDTSTAEYILAFHIILYQFISLFFPLTDMFCFNFSGRNGCKVGAAFAVIGIVLAAIVEVMVLIRQRPGLPPGAMTSLNNPVYQSSRTIGPHVNLRNAGGDSTT